MKTKAEIVQKLLDAHQITAEHAVILLTPDVKEIQYIFTERIAPSYPQIPYSPFYYDSPYTVMSQTNN